MVVVIGQGIAHIWFGEHEGKSGIIRGVAGKGGELRRVSIVTTTGETVSVPVAYCEQRP